METGRLTHHLRIGAGPSVHSWEGEQDVLLAYPAAVEADPEGVEATAELYDHMYRAELNHSDLSQHGPYVVFTNDDRGTNVGAILTVQYGVAMHRVMAGVHGDARLYQGEKMLGYGFTFGIGF